MKKRANPGASMALTSEGSIDVLSSQRALMKHTVVGILSVVLAYGFWRSHMQWDPEMRLWKAMGDASFALFTLALAVGPLSTLWAPARRLLPWRRAFGIWFALVALLHAYLVWDGWARWDLARLFGYEDLTAAGVPELVMTDPGFGLANLTGLVALFWALVLAATSSDWVMRLLGARGWKYVQQYAYVVFYLVGVHGAYFLFMHYELSLKSIVFQKGIPDPNWFRFWFVGAIVGIFLLQVASFVKTVAARRRSRRGASTAGGAPQDPTE